MISVEELRSMYYDDGMTQLEIGELYGITQSDVSIIMKKYEIKARSCSEALLVNSKKPSKAELEEMYRGKGMTLQEIGELCGVSNVTVYNWMKKYGIETRTNSESQLGNSVKPTCDELEEMYWGDGMCLREIGKLCGVDQSTVQNWMRDYGIETRTISEAMLNGDFTGEKSGNWHGGISGGKYCYKFNNKFKEAVRERDDYTCQLCGFEQKLNGTRLSIHHIHYLKEDCYPDVVALCRSCNSRVNGDRDYWEQYFENQLVERGLFCWSLNDVVA